MGIFHEGGERHHFASPGARSDPGPALPSAIRKALRLAKNDINEAVALLTNERPGLDFSGYESTDSGGPRGDSGETAEREAAGASTLPQPITKWWRAR